MFYWNIQSKVDNSPIITDLRSIYKCSVPHYHLIVQECHCIRLPNTHHVTPRFSPKLLHLHFRSLSRLKSVLFFSLSPSTPYCSCSFSHSPGPHLIPPTPQCPSLSRPQLVAADSSPAPSAHPPFASRLHTQPAHPATGDGSPPRLLLPLSTPRSHRLLIRSLR